MPLKATGKSERMKVTKSDSDVNIEKQRRVSLGAWLRVARCAVIDDLIQYYIGPVIRHNHSVVTIELLNVPSSNLYQTLTMYSRLVLQPIHETFGGIVPSKPVRYFTECRVTACRSSNASISVNATPTRRDATPVHASFSSTSKPLRFCIRNQDTKCIGRSTLWKV
jgi:hypothetical protein